jgi:hypothetical protein
MIRHLHTSVAVWVAARCCAVSQRLDAVSSIKREPANDRPLLRAKLVLQVVLQVDEQPHGSRTGRDLRTEYQAAAYACTWGKAGFIALTTASLPVFGLFERQQPKHEASQDHECRCDN